MNRATLAAVAVAGALAGVATAYFLTRTEPAPPVLERATLFEAPRPLPAIALQDQSERTFDLGRMRGHWTLLFFGFTNCPDVCPTTLATLAEVRRQLADLPPDELPEVVLATVDPVRDTPAALARYVAHFDPSFTGITGSRESIEAFTRDLGVVVMIGEPAADGSYTVDHSAAVFLVDPTAAFTALFSAPHDAATIARDYRRIVSARPQ
ncbi:MAG: SCO family protein [Steroidobacteraceae bacterium]